MSTPNETPAPYRAGHKLHRRFFQSFSEAVAYANTCCAHPGPLDRRAGKVYRTLPVSEYRTNETR